jgi:hypothetical protein
MKTRHFQSIRSILLVVIMLTFAAANSQTQTPAKPPAQPAGKAQAPATATPQAQPATKTQPASAANTQAQPVVKDGAKVKFSITNLVAVSDKVVEFDLYLKDAGSDKPFELSIIQMGILVNSEIVNGGDVGAMVVSGFSELNQPQQPSTTLFVKGKDKEKSIIKVAAKVCPGPGNGTIIKTTGKGTKVCRLRLTNTMPFAKVKPNLAFCFEKLPYPTKIYHYIGQISTQIPTNATNCVSETLNPVLNQ